MARMYRSTREAFPIERFPALFGPYRRPTRVARLLAASACIGVFIFIGAAIGARLGA